MANDIDVKKKIKEAYKQADVKKKPPTMKYVAILVIIVLVAVLFMMLTDVGRQMIGLGNSTNTVKSQQDATRIASDLGNGVSNIGGTLNNIASSLG